MIACAPEVIAVAEPASAWVAKDIRSGTGAVLALAAMWASGLAWRRALRVPEVGFGMVSLALGAAGVAWLAAVADACGVPLRAVVLVPAWCAAGAAGWILSRRDGSVKNQPCIPQQPVAVLTLLTVAGAFCFLTWVALAAGQTGVPGLGMHGYRAKLLYLAEGTPPGYFTDPGFDFSAPDTPPGWAAVGTWIYWFCGGIDERWAKLATPLFLCVAALGAARWLAGRGVPWWGQLPAALFLWCRPVLEICHWWYAEGMLMLLAVSGVCLLSSGRGAAGLFLLASCGLVKNEGVVYFLAGLGLWWFWNKGRTGTAAWKCLVLFSLAAGWQVYCRLMGAQGDNYDWTRVFVSPWPETWGRAKEVAAKAWDEMGVGAGDYVLAWWAALPLLAFAIWKRDRAAAGWIGYGLLLAGTILGAFLFSATPELRLHLVALWRVVAVPAFIFLIGAVAMSGRTGEPPSLY